MFDLKWEIGVLLGRYEKRVNKLADGDFAGEQQLKDLYAKAIIMNVQHGYGLYYPIDDFIDGVRSGSYIDYDGAGYVLDSAGNEIARVRCNVGYLENAKANGGVFVSWFNR